MPAHRLAARALQDALALLEEWDGADLTPDRKAGRQVIAALRRAARQPRGAPTIILKNRHGVVVGRWTPYTATGLACALAEARETARELLAAHCPKDAAVTARLDL